MSEHNINEPRKEIEARGEQEKHALAAAQAETLQANQELPKPGAADTAHLVSKGLLPDVDPALLQDRAAAAGGLTGLWQSGLDAASSAVQGAKNMVDNLEGKAGDLAQEGIDYAREHPVDATGYALGALVGGAVGAAVAPELGVAAGAGMLAGAAGLDLSVAGVKKLLADELE